MKTGIDETRIDATRTSARLTATAM